MNYKFLIVVPANDEIKGKITNSIHEIKHRTAKEIGKLYGYKFEYFLNKFNIADGYNKRNIFFKSI